MSGKKDLEALLNQAEKQGFRVVLANSGHYKIYSPGGRFVTTASQTPTDFRGFRNLRAHLRRAGFQQTA